MGLLENFNELQIVRWNIIKMKLFFNGHYTPKWIDISSAYAYLFAMVEVIYDIKRKVNLDQIDLLDPLQYYDIPDDSILADLDEEVSNGDTLTPAKKILRDIDLALLYRLSDGSIECQGRRYKTQKELYFLDRHEIENASAVNRHYTKKYYELINRYYWQSTWPIINYKNCSVIEWEKDSNSIFEGAMLKDKEYISPPRDMVEYDFEIWKTGWNELQVNTSDLLSSTDSLLEKFTTKQKKYENKNSIYLTKEVLEVKNENRFFYFSERGKWLIEFDGDLFEFKRKRKKADINFRTIKHLLTHGGKDFIETSEHCSWSALKYAFIEVPDEDEKSIVPDKTYQNRNTNMSDKSPESDKNKWEEFFNEESDKENSEIQLLQDNYSDNKSHLDTITQDDLEEFQDFFEQEFQDSLKESTQQEYLPGHIEDDCQQDSIDPKTRALMLQRMKFIEKEIPITKNKLKHDKMEEELSYIKNQLSKDTFAGKIKPLKDVNKNTRGNMNLKYQRFIKILPKECKKFSKHLEDNIKFKSWGVVYECDIPWYTIDID